MLHRPTTLLRSTTPLRLPSKGFDEFSTSEFYDLISNLCFRYYSAPSYYTEAPVYYTTEAYTTTTYAPVYTQAYYTESYTTTTYAPTYYEAPK